MSLTNVLSILLLSTIFLTSGLATAADEIAAHDASACAPDRLALGGHDVVAYHTLNEAVLGDLEIAVEHQKLLYRFSSEEHKQMFEAEPAKYLPHFQGWCAIALARNRLTCPDYENFKVEDGKLLLFETITFFNGQNVWNLDPINNLNSAQLNFDRLSEE